MRFTFIAAIAVLLVGCGVPEDSTEEPLDDEFGVDQNGLLVYLSTGELEEEAPVGGWEMPDPADAAEELTAEELALLPEDAAVFEEEGLIDPTLGEEELGSIDGDDTVAAEQGLVTCNKRKATGYRNGRAFSLTLVSADYKPSGLNAANAFYYMEKAAARAGVSLIVNSGFRTMAQQRYLYNCYKTKRCNNGNLAARPGYSNHQSGDDADLETGRGTNPAYRWLVANAHLFNFKATVPSEPWHWEHQ